MEKVNVFVYGTLKRPELLKSLCHKGFVKKKVKLSGYSLHNVKGAHFPGIMEREGHAVEGLLLRGITPQQLERLDRYEAEGSLYHRRTVTVHDAKGNAEQAETYVFADPKHLIQEEVLVSW